MKKVNHLKEAEKIYNKAGQAAVFDYANKHKLPYAYCKPCETNCPSHKNVCLVCGTNNEKYYQPNLDNKKVMAEIEEGNFNSFDVFKSKEIAKLAFPGVRIIEYSGNDIEEPNFVDKLYTE